MSDSDDDYVDVGGEVIEEVSTENVPTSRNGVRGKDIDWIEVAKFENGKDPHIIYNFNPIFSSSKIK